MLKIKQTALCPVILSVPSIYDSLAVRERVKFLSKYARKALVFSEQLAVNSEQMIIRQYIEGQKDLPKDENGAPLPVNGRYWSLTHKPEYVGGVIGPVPLGLDIEKIKPQSKGMKERIADDYEWSLLNPDLPESFFRFWTAKEAVLKAAGVGLSELSKCRISRIIDDFNLEISYRNRIWIAEHFFFNSYMASIVKNGFNVEWNY